VFSSEVMIFNNIIVLLVVYLIAYSIKQWIRLSFDRLVGQSVVQSL
jgi:hypothetical protein